MAGIQALDLVVEIDVVIAGVGEGGSAEQWRHLCDAGPKGRRLDETREAKHPCVAQVVPATRDQSLSRRTIQRFQGPAIEVESLSHGHTSLREFARPLPCYSQSSSSG